MNAQSPHRLHYDSPLAEARRSRRRFLLRFPFTQIAAICGFVQIPWCLIWSWHLMDVLNLVPVRLLPDTALWSVGLVFTFPAIATAIAAVCFSNARRVVVVSGLVIVVSIGAAWYIFACWHEDVFSNLGGVHPFY